MEQGAWSREHGTGIALYGFPFEGVGEQSEPGENYEYRTPNNE